MAACVCMREFMAISRFILTGGCYHLNMGYSRHLNFHHWTERMHAVFVKAQMRFSGKMKSWHSFFLSSRVAHKAWSCTKDNKFHFYLHEKFLIFGFV